MPDTLPDAESLYAQLRERLREPLRAPGVAVVGIASGGAWLAERLQADLALANPVGVISVALHRDDYATRGMSRAAGPTQLPFDVEGREIWLLDDVLYTGRTIRAAINELFDFGRPRAVRLAVLVDRGERELPMAADVAVAHCTVARGRVLELQRNGAAGAARFEFSLQDAQPT